MPRQKMKQLDKESKAFNDLIKVMQTMYKHAAKSKTGFSKFKVAHKFSTYMIEDLEKKEELKWLLQKLKEPNLNYLFKNLGGYLNDCTQHKNRRTSKARRWTC